MVLKLKSAGNTGVHRLRMQHKIHKYLSTPKTKTMTPLPFIFKYFQCFSYSEITKNHKRVPNPRFKKNNRAKHVLKQRSSLSKANANIRHLIITEHIQRLSLSQWGTRSNFFHYPQRTTLKTYLIEPQHWWQLEASDLFLREQEKQLPLVLRIKDLLRWAIALAESSRCWQRCVEC